MNIVITLFISGFVVEAASQQQGQQEPTSTSHISPGTSSGGSGTSGIGGDNTSDEKKKSNLPPNSLTESLLSPIHSQIEKQYSSLQHLAQRLTQFMSPTYGNGNDNNYRQSIPQQDQSSIDENHSLSYRPPSPTPTPTTTTTTPTSAVNNPIWNPDISRLTKGSAIRDITTAREGGKLYMISMPKYVTSGAGSMSIDNIGDDESEVNQKFLKRIHSLYTEEK